MIHPDRMRPVFLHQCKCTSSGKSRVQKIRGCLLLSQRCLVIRIMLFSSLSGPIKLLLFSCSWPGCYHHQLIWIAVSRGEMYHGVAYFRMFFWVLTFWGEIQGTGQNTFPVLQTLTVLMKPCWFPTGPQQTIWGVTVKHLFLLNGEGQLWIASSSKETDK